MLAYGKSGNMIDEMNRFFKVTLDTMSYCHLPSSCKCIIESRCTAHCVVLRRLPQQNGSAIWKCNEEAQDPGSKQLGKANKSDMSSDMDTDATDSALDAISSGHAYH